MNTYRALLIILLFIASHPLSAHWLLPGESDFTKATTAVLSVRNNISVIQIRTPQAAFNTVVLAGRDGYLLVDHPEPAASPAIQKALDGLGKRPVKFLLNTHWHYDHVGGNALYDSDAIICCARKRSEADENETESVLIAETDWSISRTRLALYHFSRHGHDSFCW